MRYQCSKQDKSTNISPAENNVKWTRKINSFVRPKRKRILLDGEDQNIDELSFNNNGHRQSSSIPFMTAEEGVSVKEEGGGKTSKRSICSARASSASTHRTFKSYAKQKMDSMRYFRTLNTAASGGRMRYFVPPESIESYRS